MPQTQGGTRGPRSEHGAPPQLGVHAEPRLGRYSRVSSTRAGPDALLNVSAFILASGSPRRALLLGTAGYTFEVIPPEVDETPHVDEQPPEYVLRLSAEKAAAVQAPPGTTVLAADTTVVLDGTPIGKPIDEADALAMAGPTPSSPDGRSCPGSGSGLASPSRASPSPAGPMRSCSATSGARGPTTRPGRTPYKEMTGGSWHP